jgi:hypothetical protein
MSMMSIKTRSINDMDLILTDINDMDLVVSDIIDMDLILTDIIDMDLILTNIIDMDLILTDIIDMDLILTFCLFNFVFCLFLSLFFGYIFTYTLLYIEHILNQIGGVKASVVASSLVDRGFESPLVHTKYIKLASVVPPLSMQH